MRQGYIVALQWINMGDVTPEPNVMSIDLPIAVNPDGSPITGPVQAELIASASQSHGNRPAVHSGTYLVSTTNGVLTVRERQTDETEIFTGDKEVLTGWSYSSNGRRISIPTPAKPGWIYEFVSTARDPIVMGIGHAATRDFLSFLTAPRSADDFGNPNPVAMPRERGHRVSHLLLGPVKWRPQRTRSSSAGVSTKTRDGRIVIDGIMPYATGAGGHPVDELPVLRTRGESSRKHERHFAHEPEFPHTFPAPDRFAHRGARWYPAAVSG